MEQLYLTDPFERNRQVKSVHQTGLGFSTSKFCFNRLKIDCEKYIGNYLEAYDFLQTPPGIVANHNQTALYEIEKQTQLYNSFPLFTGINFYEWLHKTYCEEIDKTKLDKTLFNFQDENKFINFNYTPVLQGLYKVDDRNVLHIHGDMRKVNHDDLYVPKTIFD